MARLPVALALLLIGCASAHESGAATIQAEEAPCRDDGDCAFTRVAQGACCPMLCLPRVVTRERAAKLETNTVACTGGKPESCPHPLCRPPAASVQPSCQDGRCVGRTTSAPSD